MIPRAWVNERNSVSFSNSSRSRLLNDSTKPFCIGLRHGQAMLRMDARCNARRQTVKMANPPGRLEKRRAEADMFFMPIDQSIVNASGLKGRMAIVNLSG